MTLKIIKMRAMLEIVTPPPGFSNFGNDIKMLQHLKFSSVYFLLVKKFTLFLVH